MSVRCYHMTINLAWAMRQTTAALKDMIMAETGQPLSGWDVRRRLRHAQTQRYVVLPVCETHNAKGYCCGHEVSP